MLLRSLNHSLSKVSLRMLPAKSITRCSMRLKPSSIYPTEYQHPFGNFYLNEVVATQEISCFARMRDEGF